MIEGYREKCSTKTILGPKAERPLEVDIPIYIRGCPKSERIWVEA